MRLFGLQRRGQCAHDCLVDQLAVLERIEDQALLLAAFADRVDQDRDASDRTDVQTRRAGRADRTPMAFGLEPVLEPLAQLEPLVARVFGKVFRKPHVQALVADQRQPAGPLPHRLHFDRCAHVR